MLFVWTALLGQTSKKVNCYSLEESRKIATKLVALKVCDSLLNISSEELILADSTITTLKEACVYKDSIINEQKAIKLDLESIIGGKDSEIKKLRNIAKKINRRNKIFKITTIVLGSALIGTIIGIIAK